MTILRAPNERVGYQRASRRLTRRQVQQIFEYLGEP